MAETYGFDKDSLLTIEVCCGDNVQSTFLPKGKNIWSLRIRRRRTAGAVLEDLGYFDVCAYTDFHDQAAAFVTARPMEVDVDTAFAMGQIKTWLKTCKNHTRCPNQDQIKLPTRLVDVSTAIPKLHITNGEQGHYVALSYCWGGPQRAALTQGNLSQYCQSVDTARLSQSIKDAIKVVRAVGLRYLWVDALCIVQDSDADKIHEIAGMDKVYQDALFTISAESASTAQEGFLSPRKRSLTSHQVPFRCPGGNFGSMYLYLMPSRLSLKEPLETRAWTFQEKILSSRLVMFNSETLKWSCSTRQYHLGDSLCWLEEGYGGMFGATQRFQEMLSPVNISHGLELRNPWLDKWHSLVHQYSVRYHTDHKDRLIALSGLARMLVSSRRCTYLAGLWRDDLLEQLGWRLLPSQWRPGPAYRAPSWSWASVDGEVDYIDFVTRMGENPVRPVCTIIECEVIPANKDAPFGTACDGWLVLDAPIRRGHYRLDDTKRNDQRSEIVWDGNSPSHLPNLVSTRRASDPEIPVWYVCLDTNEESMDDITEFAIISGLDHPTIQHIYGLVLKGLADGTYRRIGAFESVRSDQDVWNGLGYPETRRIKII
jgi:Heterokaryon incompatibility protein (HET)